MINNAVSTSRPLFELKCPGRGVSQFKATLGYPCASPYVRPDPVPSRHCGSRPPVGALRLYKAARFDHGICVTSHLALNLEHGEI